MRDVMSKMNEKMSEKGILKTKKVIINDRKYGKYSAKDKVCC